MFDYSSTKSCKTLLPAKPNPPLPACSQRSQIVRGESEHSTATSLLPAKPDPPLTACSLRSEIVRGESEHSTATSEARSTATSEARSTGNSLLPAKPDCQRGESEHSTTTSLLPAKPDPPLTACSLQSQIHCYQRSQIVREVRVSIPPLPACSQRSQIHHYHLTPSEATL